MRTDFLNRYWQPYPPLDRETFPFSQVIQHSDLVIAGRVIQIQKDLQEFSLERNGEMLKIKSHTPFQYRGVKESLPILDILKSGDIVAIAIHRGEGRQLLESSWEVQGVVEVELLCPAIGRPPDINLEWMKLWREFLNDIRSFFNQRGFLEVDTPFLVPSPGLEPTLDPMKVGEHYLPTSPEIHLKKILVEGIDRIFEIKKCFREGEMGPHHHSEFFMLEWYRSFNHLLSIEEDIKALVCFLLEKRGREVPSFKKVTVAALFAKHLNFQLTPESSLKALQQCAIENEVVFDSSDSWDDLFFRLFLEKIEGHLKSGAPTILCDYPPSQAALARLTDTGWADRFEFYWGGFEVANAFHELNDPAEQRRRFTLEQEEKRRLGKEVIPVDEEFLQALEYGLPPSGGIALGLERLFMAIYQLERISDFRPFLRDSIQEQSY